ncbi:MAG: DUF742 domain-containing protein [Ilumatobacter sp.]|uniref:DUF742 domain-containing protein n=1 Tax=Ilumatobacter sp. TaxID=1967498 RepID=UPI003918FEE4
MTGFGLDDDDVTVGGDVVRGFMLTRGRTRASVPELAIETVVTPTAMVRSSMGGLQVDHRRIVEILVGPLSIAEISAHLSIPLRASIVLVSEMVAAGTLSAGDSLDSGDTDLLEKIRSALQLL